MLSVIRNYVLLKKKAQTTLSFFFLYRQLKSLCFRVPGRQRGSVQAAASSLSKVVTDCHTFRLYKAPIRALFRPVCVQECKSAEFLHSGHMSLNTYSPKHEQRSEQLRRLQLPCIWAYHKFWQAADSCMLHLCLLDVWNGWYFRL